MSELSKVNTCDLSCPKRALMGVRVKAEGAVDPNGDIVVPNLIRSVLFGGKSNIVKRGIEGAQQAAYAATACPSRGAAPEVWEPSTRCREDSLAIAGELQPFTGTLPDWETAAVGRVGLGPDLLPVEQTPSPDAT